MLNKQICEKIWSCHREIETGEKLLEEVKEIVKTNESRRLQNQDKRSLKDAFGNDQNLQLGIPSGENSHRLFGVSYNLAIPVIEAHIRQKKSELEEYNAIAKLSFE